MKLRIPQIVLLLVVGAIINVAVAWACAYFSMPRFSHATTIAAAEYAPESLLPEWARGREHAAGVWHASGITELDVYAVDWSQYPTRRIQMPEQTARAVEGIMRENNPDEVVLSWLILRDQLHELRDDPELPALRCDAGWPMRSLRGWGPVTEFYRATPLGPPIAQEMRGWWSFILARDLGGGPHIVRVLPMQPLLLGFATNTLFYAVAMWSAFLAIVKGRGAIRSRCGLCSTCGYDLRGSEAGAACPECGRVGAGRRTDR